MTAIPMDRSRPKKTRLDIPKIRLLSWLGLESVAWAFIIAHLVKWAVSFGYFAAWQVSYGVGYGPTEFTVWYGKDWWDRLPVHIQNGLPGIVTAGAILATAVIIYYLFQLMNYRKVTSAIAAALSAASVGFGTSKLVTGWHVHWFPGQEEPLWWITWRHDIRDVGIAVVATIIVRLLFAKPKYPLDDNPGLKVYLTSIPLAIGAALVPIAIVGVLAWKLPWLTHHGLSVPARYGATAAEVNGWVAAGEWITVLMGIAGGLVAGLVIQRVADDIQWFFAERSAAKIRSESALSLTGSKVIGTPAHRKRVHWLLDNRPELPVRSPWLVRGLLIVGFFSVAASFAGAWLNLWGPAAPH